MGKQEGNVMLTEEQVVLLTAVAIAVFGIVSMTAIPWAIDLWDVYVKRREPVLDTMKKKWLERQ